MEVITSTPLVLTPFVIEPVTGRFQATFVAKATYKLQPGGPLELAEEQAPIAGDEFRNGEGSSLRYTSDLIPFKPKTDLLLVGHCHVPSESPLESCSTTFQVGGFSKSIHVVGDREWRPYQGVATSPKPFQQMELCYERSYGAPNNQLNPVGCGTSAKDTQDEKSWPLPNLENPDQPMRKPNDQVTPISYGPIGSTWQPRVALLGTMDQKWQETRWPGYPADFDWAHFNCAPFDQQAEGYLKGDESLFFENLHPQVSRYTSKLPGIAVKSYLYTETKDRSGQSTKRFHSLPMNLDTLWVDMDQEQVVLIWRGVAPVSDARASEVKYWYLLSEDRREVSANDQVYYARFKQELQEKLEADAVMSAEEAETQNQQLQESFGPDAPAFPTDLAGQPLSAQIAAVLAVGKAVEQKSRAKSESHVRARGLDPKQVAAQQKNTSSQRMRAFGAHKAAWKQVDEAENRGQPTHEFKASLHEQGLGPDPPADMEPITQENFFTRIKAGEVIDSVDLTALDLNNANLANAQLPNCYFAGMVLQQTDFSGANLSGALFRGANLEGALLERANCQRADFTEATLTGAKAGSTNFDEACFEKASMEDAELCDVTAVKAIFCEAKMARTLLLRSNLTEADFTKADLSDAKANEAILDKANLNEVNAPRVELIATRLNEMRAILGANLQNANLHQAEGIKTAWLNGNLNEADFSYAKLPQAFFMEANLEQANFTACVLKKARFGQAQGTRCNFQHADLFESDFLKANLTEAVLKQANAYGANFTQTTIHQTDLDGANLEMTRLA